MAVALSPEDSGFFASASGLNPCDSHPRFQSHKSGFRKSASTSQLDETYSPVIKHRHHSLNSSPPSTPQTPATESTDLSYALTPATNVSDGDKTISVDPNLDSHHAATFQPASLHFPPYGLDLGHHEDLEAPASPPTGDSYTVSSNELEGSSVASTPVSPDVVPKGFDDIAVQQAPSHHVDYLSHNWREEDIWASWKYVTSNRSEYPNADRLENASWRTWMKSKNRLKTISPEKLNWLKDCDVTWLYGPLQRGSVEPPQDEQPASSSLSQSASFLDKKPILKKRSMSEVMLQQSLSAASLLKQATAAVQAQQSLAARRPIITRANTDSPAFIIAPMSRESSLVGSSDTSGIASPNTEKRRIHFNEQVEQCIAVDVKGDDEHASFMSTCDDSESDDCIMMMVSRKRRIKSTPKKSALKNAEPKTIASLPSTTLKYRDDYPGPRETAMKHSYKSPVMSPSSSQETLKPSKKPAKSSVNLDSSPDEDGDDQTPTPRAHSPSPVKSPSRPSETGSNPLRGVPLDARLHAGLGSGTKRSTSTRSLNLGSEGFGMRRTSSGMLMPIEEGETSEKAGIVGRIIDTVNTARDIAHVIWNVGWRR